MHPNVLLLFLIIQITKVYYLDYHCVFHGGRGYKNVPITFFVWNPCPSPYNFKLDLCWLNCSLDLVIAEPVYFFLHILQVSRYTTHTLLQSKWKFILKTSPVTVLLNSFPGSNILHISQLLCPQGKFPFSPSSFSLILHLTNLSRNVFGLQNATRGGFGNTAFNVGEFSIKR